MPEPGDEEQVAGAVVGVEVAAVVRVAVAGRDVLHRQRRLVDRVLVERDRHGDLLGLRSRCRDVTGPGYRDGPSAVGEQLGDAVHQRVERRRGMATEGLHAEERLGHPLLLAGLQEDEQRRGLARRRRSRSPRAPRSAGRRTRRPRPGAPPRAARRTRRRSPPRAAPAGCPSIASASVASLDLGGEASAGARAPVGGRFASSVE